LRPGRFDRLIEIGLPDEQARREILKIHTAKKPLADDVKIEDLAKRTAEFSGADLGALVGEAVMLAIRECVLGGKAKENAQFCEYKLENKHFEAALKTVKPTASEADIYKRFA
jgi:transitional endoplasmic reticulum ATPase